MLQKIAIALFMAISVLQAQMPVETAKPTELEAPRGPAVFAEPMTPEAIKAIRERLSALKLQNYTYKHISASMEFLNYCFNQRGEAPPDVTAEIEKCLQDERRSIQQNYGSGFDLLESLEPVSGNNDSTYWDWSEAVVANRYYGNTFHRFMEYFRYAPPKIQWTTIGPNTLPKFDDDTIRKYNSMGRAHELTWVWHRNNEIISVDRFFENAIFHITDVCYNLALYAPGSRADSPYHYRTHKDEYAKLVIELRPSNQRLDAEFWAVVREKVEIYRGLWPVYENDLYHQKMLVELNRIKREIMPAKVRTSKPKVAKKAR